MNRNIIVVFPTGAGGNHLANMLSTATGFHTRASITDYHNIKINNNVHKGLNLRVDWLRSGEHFNRSNVLCGHLGELIWFSRDDVFNKFKNIQFVVIGFPTDTKTIEFKRVCKTISMSGNLGVYHIAELETLYSPSILESITGINDFVKIKPSELFNADVSNVLSRISYDFNLDLDTELCKRMHSIWYNHIITKIKNK